MKIYRLNIGQPDLPTPQKALDALKNVDRSTLEYSPSQGYRSLRKALVNYYERYQIKLSADDRRDDAGTGVPKDFGGGEGREKAAGGIRQAGKGIEDKACGRKTKAEQHGATEDYVYSQGTDG